MRDCTSSDEEIAVFSFGPAVVALVCPGSLDFFHRSVRIFHSANHPYVSGTALIIAVLSLSLAYVVPAFSFVAASALGTRDHPSRQSEHARLLAHLAFASPPLFTAVGVLVSSSTLQNRLPCLALAMELLSAFSPCAGVAARFSRNVHAQRQAAHERYTAFQRSPSCSYSLSATWRTIS
jgi:hypothetical protein